MENEDRMDVNKEVDRFTEFMFGKRASASKSSEIDQEKETSSQINYEEIMNNIDIIMDSAKQLKPLFNNISPFISKFLK